MIPRNDQSESESEPQQTISTPNYYPLPTPLVLEPEQMQPQPSVVSVLALQLVVVVLVLPAAVVAVEVVCYWSVPAPVVWAVGVEEREREEQRQQALGPVHVQSAVARAVRPLLVRIASVPGRPVQRPPEVAAAVVVVVVVGLPALAPAVAASPPLVLPGAVAVEAVSPAQLELRLPLLLVDRSRPVGVVVVAVAVEESNRQSLTDRVVSPILMVPSISIAAPATEQNAVRSHHTRIEYCIAFASTIEH